jgi:drug/metabolite transporter (DMT)-like permease
MQAIIFALVSFFGWGIGETFTGQASRKLGTYPAAFWTYFLGLAFSSVLIPFVLRDLRHLSLAMFLLTLVLSVILVLCWIAFNEALNTGNSILVGSIAESYVVLVVILSIIFLGEKLTILQVLVVLLTFSGLMLASLNFADLKKVHANLTDKSIILAILCMLGWGIYFTFIKIPVNETGWFWPNYISLAVGTAVFPIFWLKKLKMPTNRQRGFSIAVLSAVLVTAGTFSFNYAISHGSLAVVAPIAGSYPVLFILLSSFILKDHVTNQQKLGVLVTLSGIVALSALSI